MARVRVDRLRSRNTGPRSEGGSLQFRKGSPPHGSGYAPMVCEGDGRWGHVDRAHRLPSVLPVVGHHQQALEAVEVKGRSDEPGLRQGVAVLLDRLHMADEQSLRGQRAASGPSASSRPAVTTGFPRPGRRSRRPAPSPADHPAGPAPGPVPESADRAPPRSSRVSTMSRTVAVSLPTETMLPASAPPPRPSANDRHPDRQPLDRCPRRCRSPVKFDGSRLMMRTGRSMSSDCVRPSRSCSSAFSTAASCSSAMRCSADAVWLRSSSFSPRSRSISPMVPKTPAIPDPMPPIVCRMGSSASALMLCSVWAGSVWLASRSSSEMMVEGGEP